MPRSFRPVGDQMASVVAGPSSYTCMDLLLFSIPSGDSSLGLASLQVSICGMTWMHMVEIVLASYLGHS